MANCVSPVQCGKFTARKWRKQIETSQIGQWAIPILYSHHPTLSNLIFTPPPLAISKVENADQWLKITPFLWNSKVPQQGCVG
jgi:hypothetical protein